MAFTRAEIRARFKARHPDKSYYDPARCRAYYEANKEKMLARIREWQINNPDKRRATKKKWYSNNRSQALLAQDKYRKENARKYLFSRARLRAKKLGREFNITIDDVVIPEECPLLNVAISSYSEHQDFRPSLDRIDSSKGYVKGNVQVISAKANRLKNNASSEELMNIALNMMRLEGKIS